MQFNFSKYFKGDKILWIVIIGLALFSIPAVFSATGSLAYKYQDGDTSYYLLRHGFFVILGLATVYFTHKLSYKVYFNIATGFLIFTILLLILTLLIGKTINEATRWLEIPVIGLDFQTSDVAKLALIIYVAKILSVNQNSKINLKKAFYIILAATSLTCIFILPANLSTTLLLGATVFIMMFIGRIEQKYLASLLAIAVVGFGLFVLVVMTSGKESRLSTWKARIENFVSGEDSENFQSLQSKIAIAKGGWTGKGSGNSEQRTILPHPYSDFIYSVIIEEYGFLGGIMVLLAYLVILFRGIMIVKRTERTFPAFLAVGISTIIVLQSIINMGVAVGIFPVTGQPLPLVSMGGTSTVMTALSLGILLNISKKEENKTLEEKKQEEKFEVKDYPFIMG